LIGEVSLEVARALAWVAKVLEEAVARTGDDVGQSAGRSIRHVIVRAGGVVDRVLAAASSTPLQPDKLGGEPVVVQQLGCARVQQRQAVAVQVALGPGGGFVTDARLVELLLRPLAGVAVALDGDDPVAAEQLGIPVQLGRCRKASDLNRTNRTG
jgi:hypothetical protein